MAGICPGRKEVTWSAFAQRAVNDAGESRKLREQKASLKSELEAARRELRRRPAIELDARDAESFAETAMSQLEGDAGGGCPRCDSVSRLRAPQVVRDDRAWVDALLNLQRATIADLTGERGVEVVEDRERRECRRESALCRVGFRQQVINSAARKLTNR